MSAAPCELILPHRHWEAAVRGLLARPRSVATGLLRLRSDRLGTILLCDSLTIAERALLGSERPPLTDWCVLSLGEAGTPADLLATIEPYRSQRVVVLTMPRARAGAWDGLVFDRGEVTALAGVRLVGPGMIALSREPVDPLEPAPAERWSRTIGALGEPLWRAVRASHVLLIGCGRNGTQLAWQLAGLGVARLTLIDPDRLGVENLDAMPGLRFADVGRPKVEALAERLIDLNPDLTLSGHVGDLVDVLDRVQSRPDLIVTCVDDDTPRMAASWLARERLVPHLDIGTSVQHGEAGNRPVCTGDVRLLLPFEGCVDCVGGLADREKTLYEIAAPPGSLHLGPPVAWNERRAGSLVQLNSVAVGVAVEQWLTLLRGTASSQWARIDLSHRGDWQIRRSDVQAGEKCVFCRPPTTRG